MSPRELAERFSTHDFASTVDLLAPDIVWRTYGAPVLHGRDAVIEACTATAAALANVVIDRKRLVVVDGGDTVAVDTITEYRDPTGTSTVASCDIYEFRAGELVVLTSYTVEV